MSFECPKSSSPKKVANFEESTDFEHQRLSKAEHLDSNHQMRKTLKDSTKSNSKRDIKSGESDDDYYEEDYEEYDEDYEEDFEEYCSENEEEEENLH